MKIPKRIIQTGKSRNLSPLTKAAVTNVKLLNPDWEYCYFDNNDVNDFISTHFRQFRATFDGFKIPIQRYDFFRYLAVLHYGGFYFDLDVFFSESLSPLLVHSCVFPFEELTLSTYFRREFDLDWEIGNYGFGAEAGHPFIAKVVENCVKAQQDPSWIGPMLNGIPPLFRKEFFVLNTTGPGQLTRTLAENPQLGEDLTVLFPDDVRDQKSWHLFGRFGIHAMEGSWRTKGSFLHRRFALWWEARLMKKLSAESAKRGPTRTLNFDPVCKK